MTRSRVFRLLPLVFFSLLLSMALIPSSYAQEPEPAAEAPAADESPAAEAPDEAAPSESDPVTEEPQPVAPPVEEPADPPAPPAEEPPPAVPPADEPADRPTPPAEPQPEVPPPAEKPTEEPKPEPKPQPKQPQPKDLTATTLEQVDEDFAYQGEYASASRGGFGLQVVALGQGQFDAVLYPGGLPGAGWAGGTKYQMNGSLENGRIYFAGEPYSLKVYGSYAELLRDGWHAGFLNKTNRTSPTMHAAAPRDATILFDGSSLDAFEKAKFTPEGWLASGTSTNEKVQDFRLHLEFRLPYKPSARGQGRGNSGVYIQRRYEVQVLDSFGLEGEANECGGLYRQKAPDVNMCLPPLSWQTYDIYFRAARFDDEGKKIENARITVLHNGYPVHSDYELTGKTGAGRQETPEPGEIYLQDHGNPVAFRNIWLVEGEQAATPGGCPPRCVPCCQPPRQRRLFRR